jgi:hypothetical protein
MKILRRLALLGVVSAAGGLITQAFAAQDPFTVTIRAYHSAVKVGHPVIVSVTVTNTSQHKIECATPYNSALGMDILNEYDIRDGSGNPVEKNTPKHEGFVGSFPPATIVEPGESKKVDDDVVSKLYNLSRPGRYTIQASRAVSGDPSDVEVVKSNTIAVTVTDDDDVIERATPPFSISIGPYSNGRAGTTEDGLTVKVGEEVGINIVKRNTSIQREEDCTISHNSMTGLDDKFQYDVRDSSGNPVGKLAIKSPEPFTMGPSHGCTLKPGQSQASVATMTRLYDLSRPGKYTIQVSQPVSDNPEDGVVKSNTIVVTVTE